MISTIYYGINDCIFSFLINKDLEAMMSSESIILALRICKQSREMLAFSFRSIIPRCHLLKI